MGMEARHGRRTFAKPAASCALVAVEVEPAAWASYAVRRLLGPLLVSQLSGAKG